MKNIETNLKKLPFVSVIVAARNEQKYIKKCLKSLISQNYPKDKYEIIVVDGMSTDATREIVLKFLQKYRNISLLDNPKLIYPSALNIGIKHAKGSIIVKIDAHIYIAEDFINKNVEFLQKTDAVCTGGPIKTIGDGFIGKTIALVLTSIFGTGGAKFRCDPGYEGYVDTVPFGAYKKEVFEKAGPYDESKVRTEDLDLHARIRKMGGRFYTTPEIKPYYYSRSTLQGLIKQSFSNGYEIISAFNAISLRHIMPFFFMNALLMSLALSPFFLLAKIIFISVLGSYFSMNLFFSLRISFQKGLKYLPILLLTFFTLHFSYGLGSIWGLITFFKKK